MNPHAGKTSDLLMLNAVLAFVATHPDNVMERFREAVAHWGDAWCAVAPAYLAASETL